MALIGETGGEADVGQGSFRREHLFASGTDAEAMNVVADTFAEGAAENTREVDGMDAGFASQLIKSKAAGMLGLQLVEDAGEPRRGVAAFGMIHARGAKQNLRKQAFDGEFVCDSGCLDFAKQLHAQPKERAAGDIVARSIEGGGTLSESLLPRGAQLDFKQANAARPDFVLVGNARGTEHKRKRTELRLLAAIAFTVMAFEQQGKERQFVGVHWEFAGSGVAQVGEDGAALLVPGPNGSEEAARAHVLAGGTPG